MPGQTDIAINVAIVAPGPIVSPPPPPFGGPPGVIPPVNISTNSRSGIIVLILLFVWVGLLAVSRRAS